MSLNSAVEPALAHRGVPPGIGAGVYSSSPWETSFLALTEDAGWKSPYGQFFLKWYSEKLIKCDRPSCDHRSD